MQPQPTDTPRQGEYRVPDSARVAECKSCHAKIVWTKTSKNGRAVPLSLATIRTDPDGTRWALTHFADCPHSKEHRKPTTLAGIKVDDLFMYLRARQLIVTHSIVSDDDAGRLIVELFTRSIA